MIVIKTTEDFKKEVYDLVGDEYSVLGEYIATKIKIKMKHNTCGNVYEVRPDGFLRSRRCPVCAKKLRSKHRKKTTEDFKKEVYELVGDEYSVLGEYEKSDIKISMKHNTCGNVYEVRPNNFIRKQNNGCPKCNKGIKKLHIEFLKEVYDLVGDEYSVLGEYENNITKIKMKHNTCGNVYEVRPNNFLKDNNRCPKCFGNNLKTTENFKKDVYDLVGDEYSVLGEYENTNTKILMKHNECGNTYEAIPSMFTSVHLRRCPKCNNSQGFSNKEKELLSFIKDNYNGIIIENDRIILNGKEIDIYLPELKIGIEFDGLYWHSELYIDNNYHLDKTLKCKEKGIQLIHIFEDEWINKQSIIQSKLKHILKLNNKNKIFARKCYIEEVNPSDKNNFLNENHIQGKDSSFIKLGLWYPLNENEDILLAVMTFCKPRRSLGQKNNSIYDYELSRYATQIEYIVVGGFSKLLKYFERNYKWSKIITYADIRHSKGNIYELNNFLLTHTSKPNYWYFKNTNRLHRYNFRKQKLKELFPYIYTDNKTEKEIMKEAGYLRIYDCGNMVFEYTKQGG